LQPFHPHSPTPSVPPTPTPSPIFFPLFSCFSLSLSRKVIIFLLFLNQTSVLFSSMRLSISPLPLPSLPFLSVLWQLGSALLSTWLLRGARSAPPPLSLCGWTGRTAPATIEAAARPPAAATFSHPFIHLCPSLPPPFSPLPLYRFHSFLFLPVLSARAQLFKWVKTIYWGEAGYISR